MGTCFNRWTLSRRSLDGLAPNLPIWTSLHGHRWAQVVRHRQCRVMGTWACPLGSPLARRLLHHWARLGRRRQCLAMDTWICLLGCPSVRRLLRRFPGEIQTRKVGPVNQVKLDRPEVAYSSESKSRTLPRVSFASLGARKRKKKLVISGIAAGDTRKFEAAKRWCETFGEVSQITRMPNDDLHVNFRNADVADTVCRLRAKVYIRGVGSVILSWYMKENIR
ncbi:hypothetical protein C8J57DRAFT_16578 [Mycena rebaudengoi]|nr:hypothetical protein C8J57DRAFT_16578 [Mycena rebaudengoi]